MPKDKPTADAAPDKDAPQTDAHGRLTVAWTDDSTGKTFMPGEKIEGDDGK